MVASLGFIGQQDYDETLLTHGVIFEFSLSCDVLTPFLTSGTKVNRSFRKYCGDAKLRPSFFFFFFTF